MTAKPWTTTEEAHLRKWAGIALVTQIAADLGRTNSSIYKKMQALKLKGVKQGEKHSQAKTTRLATPGAAHNGDRPSFSPAQKAKQPPTSARAAMG